MLNNSFKDFLHFVRYEATYAELVSLYALNNRFRKIGYNSNVLSPVQRFPKYHINETELTILMNPNISDYFFYEILEDISAANAIPCIAAGSLDSVKADALFNSLRFINHSLKSDLVAKDLISEKLLTTLKTGRMNSKALAFLSPRLSMEEKLEITNASESNWTQTILLTVLYEDDKYPFELLIEKAFSGMSAQTDKRVDPLILQARTVCLRYRKAEFATYIKDKYNLDIFHYAEDWLRKFLQWPEQELFS